MTKAVPRHSTPRAGSIAQLAEEWRQLHASDPRTNVQAGAVTDRLAAIERSMLRQVATTGDSAEVVAFAEVALADLDDVGCPLTAPALQAARRLLLG